jgi:hypothetical protein
MNSLVENLKSFFASKSKEELKAIWESGAHLDSIGMKVTDYLEKRGYHVKIVDDKINFEKVNFNDNLGSNSYSNLFLIFYF